MLYVMFPFAVFAIFLFSQVCRNGYCPDCGARLPTLMSPLRKSRRMWWEGVYLRSRCGCETDLAGRKVTADTPLARFPASRTVLATLAVLLGIGLGAACLFRAHTYAPAPPSGAAPQRAPDR